MASVSEVAAEVHGRVQAERERQARASLIEQRRCVQVSAPELLNVALLVRLGTG